jgi:type 1 glutamine amidotransferase
MRISIMRRPSWAAVADRRRGLSFAVALLAVLAVADPACAKKGMDCPLARAPYSSQTPLIDLMINPDTRAIVERDLGPIMSHMPSFMSATSPPTFGAIISPRELAAMGGGKDMEARLVQLDADLARVPVTQKDMSARCARYDKTPPHLPDRLNKPALLVFDKITGFRDGPSVDAATAALKAMAARRGWTLYFSDNGAVFNARDLARFDAVIWNNVSGDALTVPQEKAFQAYLAKGGGFAGFHGAAGDPIYVWPWYPDTLIGARFAGHPMNPQFQVARVVVADPASAITRGLGEGWSMTEEWYSFKTNPRATGAHILATLDESSYSPRGFRSQDLHMGDHPIAWTRCLGNGRSFYTAIGHRPESYMEPHAVALLEQGITWAAGLGETRCDNGRETPR